MADAIPYNYSDDVWVDPRDADAVEERWQIFRHAIDGDDVIAALETYWTGR